MQGNRVRCCGAPSSSLCGNKANFKHFATACEQMRITAVDADDVAYWDNLLDCRGKAMTEVWYQQSNTNANYSDAHTTESCAKCRVMVPRMLCGYKGKV